MESKAVAELTFNKIHLSQPCIVGYGRIGKNLLYCETLWNENLIFTRKNNLKLNDLKKIRYNIN